MLGLVAKYLCKKTVNELIDSLKAPVCVVRRRCHSRDCWRGCCTIL